jgi:uncharacterized Zn finger protein
MICSQCGSEYEFTSKAVSWRDSDSIECEVCGYTLKTWSGSRIYVPTLLKRGDWPRRESTGV